MESSRNQIVAIHTNLWNVSGVATTQRADPSVTLHRVSPSCTCIKREPLSSSCLLHEVEDSTEQSPEGFDMAQYKTGTNELRESDSSRMRNTAQRRKGTWTNIFNPIQANSYSTFPSPPESAASDDDRMDLQDIEPISSRMEIMNCFGFTADEQSSLLAALKHHQISSDDVDDLLASYDYEAVQGSRCNEDQRLDFERWIWQSLDRLF
ncbi:hypothetical protein FSARC_3413 [Fusarium sarcochroum]|uniref:Uncharacterized protein n=1 Tax=Fusarium sarcochroum TaxID=1208366 RepID=A0A8H4U4I4_9HYPO|nr:hypothetical protein FSARC_3413 [Fusarium sarcochroum]